MENNLDIIIAYVVIYVIEAFIMWHYCVSMFDSKRSKYFEFFGVFPLYLALVYTVLFENMFLNMAAFIVVNFIYIFYFYEAKWYTAFFHSLITACVMGLSEMTIAGIIPNLVYDIYNQDSVLQRVTILTVFSKLLYLLVVQWIIYIFGKTKEKVYRNNKGFWLLAMIPVITVWITITLALVSINTQLSKTLEYMASISAFLLLFINVLVFGLYRYNQAKEAEYYELQLQVQKEYDAVEYYKMLLQEDENQNILIHDIKKHLQSISLLNEQGAKEKITEYIEEIIHSSDLQSSVRICNHEFLNAILCRYARSCEKKDISLRADIRSDSLNFMSDNDLTALFCNLMDNALEAASKVQESYIELSVSLKSGTNIVVISMINSCEENPLNSAGGFITRKQDKKSHGYGMKSIKRIISNYDGEMNLYFEEESSSFHTIIMLKSLQKEKDG